MTVTEVSNTMSTTDSRRMNMRVFKIRGFSSIGLMIFELFDVEVSSNANNRFRIGFLLFRDSVILGEFYEIADRTARNLTEVFDEFVDVLW